MVKMKGKWQIQEYWTVGRVKAEGGGTWQKIILILKNTKIIEQTQHNNISIDKVLVLYQSGCDFRFKTGYMGGIINKNNIEKN